MPCSPFTWFRGVICANQLEIFLALLHWNRGRITALFDTYTSTAGFFEYVFDLLLGLFEFDVVFLQAELVFLIQLLGLLFLLQALHVPIELLHRLVPQIALILPILQYEFPKMFFIDLIRVLVIATLGYGRSLVAFIIVLRLRTSLLGSLLFLLWCMGMWLYLNGLYFEYLLHFDLVFV